MKKIAGLFLCLMLTGCLTTNPVLKAPNWPDPPGKQSLDACPALKELSKDIELSDIASVVVDNYSTYYQCAVKLEAWIEWYNLQKNIYENATK
jgi:hypothetical protein